MQPTLRFPLLLSLALFTTIAVLPIQAQVWRGNGVLDGQVTTTEGEPIVGATVELRWVDDPATGPPAATTNRKGNWRIVQLALGRYELHIRATGYINVNGFATVVTEGMNEGIEAQMLPLSWEPPQFSEAGSSHTLRLWIEKGNSLLEQNQTTAAREQYERALAQLPAGSQPEVLRSIARTYFLEGKSELAINSLRQALDLAPADTDSRQLFVLLMDQENRGQEALETLEALDARPLIPPTGAKGSLVASPIEIPEEVRQRLAAPTVAPEPHRVGRYKTSFSQRSQWSRLDEFAGRLGASEEDILAQDPDAGDYDLSAETFEVVVPETYRPGEPWGLLVWISPTPFGGTLRPEMEAALNDHRLIWIGANRAGNDRVFWERIWLALDAADSMRSLYDLDAARIYVAGYSGGGRLASQLGVLYPEVFQGAWALFGCDYFRAIPVVERPGTHYPAKYAPPADDVLEAVQRRNRFVLVTGTRDFNFTQTRSTARAMQHDGFDNVTYLEIPGADHYSFPDGAWLDRIFAALDPR